MCLRWRWESAPRALFSVAAHARPAAFADRSNSQPLGDALGPLLGFGAGQLLDWRSATASRSAASTARVAAAGTAGTRHLATVSATSSTCSASAPPRAGPSTSCAGGAPREMCSARPWRPASRRPFSHRPHPELTMRRCWWRVIPRRSRSRDAFADAGGARLPELGSGARRSGTVRDAGTPCRRRLSGRDVAQAQAELDCIASRSPLPTRPANRGAGVRLWMHEHLPRLPPNALIPWAWSGVCSDRLCERRSLILPARADSQRRSSIRAALCASRARLQRSSLLKA